MARVVVFGSAIATAVVAIAASSPPTAAPGTRLLGWNDLGMHCMDADYRVFAILPPFNTVHAQLVRDGRLVADPAGVTVTYEAVADAAGSINTTSAGKTDFWEHAEELFGASLAADVGLAGKAMPGAANEPRAMDWDAQSGGWVAVGVPITPYDDSGARNPYPLMRLVARDAEANVIATTDVVLPVSDEMDCSACHASDGSPAARPLDGWVHVQDDPQRDWRLNVLRRHDDVAALGDFAGALQFAGYDPGGLYDTALGGRAVLCAKCHSSNALGTAGYPGLAPLTRVVHSRHAIAVDPVEGLALAAMENRSACYRCHPGALTRCLRGAMGNSVAPDGTLAMQCQNCHGSMLVVGDADRRGWLDEPTCQSCHTGTAVANSGQIRFLDAYADGIHFREPADATYASNPDTPAAGLSLYRFSRGHGGLACEACHGSPHAEFPSSHENDDAQSLAAQGHAGTLVECAACHGSAPDTVVGGPHGMHPVGQGWVERHGDATEGDDDRAETAACRACHGGDDRGTVLSKALADRVLDAYGTQRIFRGSIIGCYQCHDGPSSESPNQTAPPSAKDGSASTQAGVPVGIDLVATDAPGSVLAFRVVSQPAHGTTGLLGSRATYRPEPGFVGIDSFTFAARDGFLDSNLATVQVAVGPATPLPDLRAAWRSLKVKRTRTKTRLRAVFIVSNAGPVAAPVSTAWICVSPDGVFHEGDAVLKGVPVKSLAPGRSRRLSVKVAVPEGMDVRGRYAIVVANADGAVAEADRANDAAASGPMK